MPCSIPSPEHIGVLLRSIRLRKRIGMRSLAQQMGWGGNTPIIRIEKGQSHPDLTTLERWLDSLDASASERYLAIGLAGYLSHTIWPSLKEIKVVIGEYAQGLSEHPYPAYIVDYGLNVWAINDLTRSITGSNTPENLLRQQIDLFDCFYNSTLNIPVGQHDRLQSSREQIRRFKVLNIQRQHEPFYRAYPNCFRDHPGITEADYARFEADWCRVTVQDPPRRPETNGLIWVLQLPDHTELYIQTLPQFIMGLNGCFMMTSHQPYDHPALPDNRLRAENYFRRFRGVDKHTHLLWEYSDPQVVLRRFQAL